MNYFFLGYVFIALHVLNAPLHAMVRAGVEVDHDEDDDYYEYDYWQGPGFYYGIWFDNEWDYDGWHEGHGHHHGREGHHEHGGGGHHEHGGGGHHEHGGGGHHRGGGGHH
ncbi:MAG TPA: hypothetical protein VLE95_03615 [Chlamydiales bacterium]|nr:hypothetical protein [Chlamydiales bacterium]